MKRVWSIYGMVQVNTEEEGYSKIVYDGETRPVLKAPSDIRYGWKNLTAIYDDEFKGKYLGTLRRTLIYIGAKVYINCPCVFYNEGEDTVTLKADLFYHNRRVPGGSGSFFYQGEILQPEYIPVVDGVAKQTFSVPDDMDITEKSNFEFKFYASTDYELAPDSDKGVIFISYVPENKTPLSVDVQTVITNMNEDTTLIARVYHKNYIDYVKYPDDLLSASEGYVIFYVEGERVETNGGKYKFDINTAGFAKAPYKVTQDVGAYNITANFYPDTPDSMASYVDTGGCGTLYVGDEPDKPLINYQPYLCTYLNNDSKSVTLISNAPLSGNLKLYMDRNQIKLLNANNEDGSIDVDGITTVTFEFDTNGSLSNSDYWWNYAGYHNFSLKYSIDEGDYHLLEHEYCFDDFFIQRETAIEVMGDLDNNYITYNGESIFVGNNLYYPYNNTYRWYSPTNRERSMAIGNDLVIKVKDVEKPEKLVNEGFVKITFISRDNHTLEENLDGW